MMLSEGNNMKKQFLLRSVIISCVIVQILSSITGLFILFNGVLENLHEAGCVSLNLPRFIFCVIGVCFPLAWGFVVLSAFDKAQKTGSLASTTIPPNKPRRTIRLVWPQIIKIEKETHDDE